jgi:hypothetical protein
MPCKYGDRTINQSISDMQLGHVWQGSGSFKNSSGSSEADSLMEVEPFLKIIWQNGST